MRPVSDTFLRIVRGSHRMCARARVVTAFTTGVNPGPLNVDGSPVNEIPIFGGDVKLDANADIRATVDLTTDGTGMWPASTGDLLTPYGHELFIERGIEFGSGDREWVSQGYFRIDDVDQDEVSDGPIRIIGKDRMSGIVDARLEAPVQFTAGTSLQTVFSTLVGEVYPSVTILYDFDAAGTSLAGSLVAEEDRYKFLLDATRAHGKVMFFDHEGKLRVQSAPDPATSVFDVNSGRDGVLVKMSRSLSRQGVYNAVVATGEAPGEAPPVRAVARDLNPNSPTYYFGPFGKVPRPYSSPFITTTEQAGTAATAMLTRSLGLPYNVDFAAVPNPALEPLDPIRVSHPDRAELHILEKLTIPLVASGALTATTREKTNIQIGLA